MTQMATEKQLGKTITVALGLRDQMRADGMPEDELAAWFEGVVRQAWPFRRPWSPRCDACGDYGLVIKACEGEGRSICGRRFPHDGHTFGEHCHCEAGRRYVPKAQRPDDFADAGKARKPTRFGR